jgi:hypothetical protein
MKKLFTLFVFVAASLTHMHAYAQAFGTGTTLLSFGIGPGEMIHFPVGNNNPFGNYALQGSGFTGTRPIITGQLALQAEFAVHKYVGVGFVIGVGGRAESNLDNGSLIGLGFAKEVNVPIGLLANFHFFQLIADKKGLALGDKLDVYAGITAGSGVAIHPYKNNANDGGYNFYDALFYFGPHAGVSYYFSPTIAVNGEVGWGTTLVQAGLVFKVGGAKSK